MSALTVASASIAELPEHSIKQASVLIFDEATSALDNEAEQAVMQAIEGLSQNLTILIIARRLTTLKNCTQIIELDNSGILRCGSYEKIIK